MTRWVLVRWMEGVTHETLVERDRSYGRERDDRTFDKERRLSFCGPLTVIEPFPGDPLNRTLGFPRGEVGEISIFASFEEAVARVQEKGDWISIDVPTPIEALHFSAVDYYHYDGSLKVLYDGGDYERAFGEVKYRLGQLGAESVRHRVNVECAPLFDRLGENRPSEDRAEAMNAVARSFRSKRDQNTIGRRQPP